ETFPALNEHFKQYLNTNGTGKSKGLTEREDMGDYWWELRPCDYYPEFEKEKIVWQEIVYEPRFCYDTSKTYVEASGFIMTGRNITYVCGLLNSMPVSLFFKLFYAGGGLGEQGYRYKKAFLERLPLPPPTPQNQPIVSQIEDLVKQITQTKKTLGCSADTSELEIKIDQLVYQLYGLTEEEIKLIENSGIS
ncbi:MAG: class I SAM-dependent DNA methyltransferase, partial [Aquificaceae bacterium]|nr:class I SAM-dependent DNA methyltransferase [Aquificaceae bacterium]